MRTQWLLVALAALLMGVSFYRPKSRDSRPSAELARSADLSAQVARLTAELSTEKERSERALAARDARPAAAACLQASAQTPSAMPAAKPAAPPPAEPARPASEPPADKVYEPAQELMTTFEAEVTDASWASGAEDTLEQRITSALPSSASIQSVECRSSMCRVTTVHHDSQTYESFLDAAFKSPETRVWSADALSEAMPNMRGTGTLVVSYVAREGQMLTLRAN